MTTQINRVCHIESNAINFKKRNWIKRLQHTLPINCFLYLPFYIYIIVGTLSIYSVSTSLYVDIEVSRAYWTNVGSDDAFTSNESKFILRSIENKMIDSFSDYYSRKEITLKCWFYHSRRSPYICLRLEVPYESKYFTSYVESVGFFLCPFSSSVQGLESSVASYTCQLWQNIVRFDNGIRGWGYSCVSWWNKTVIFVYFIKSFFQTDRLFC